MTRLVGPSLPVLLLLAGCGAAVEPTKTAILLAAMTGASA